LSSAHGPCVSLGGRRFTQVESQRDIFCHKHSDPNGHSLEVCFVGETSRHLLTRIREHLNRDRISHIFQHLQQSEARRNSCSAECFKVIDHATRKFQVKIKEALHISWEQPSLNKQLHHVNLTLSF